MTTTIKLAETLLVLTSLCACERAQTRAAHPLSGSSGPAVGNIGQTGRPEPAPRHVRTVPIQEVGASIERARPLLNDDQRPATGNVMNKGDKELR